VEEEDSEEEVDSVEEEVDSEEEEEDSVVQSNKWEDNNSLPKEIQEWTISVEMEEVVDLEEEEEEDVVVEEDSEVEEVDSEVEEVDSEVEEAAVEEEEEVEEEDVEEAVEEEEVDFWILPCWIKIWRNTKCKTQNLPLIHLTMISIHIWTNPTKINLFFSLQEFFFVFVFCF